MATASPTISMLKKKMKEDPDPVQSEEVEEAPTLVAGEAETQKEVPSEVEKELEEVTPVVKEKGKGKKVTAKGPNPKDTIVKMVHTIENLTRAKALAEAQVTADNSSLNAFRLGGLLQAINSKGFYDDYDTFKAYVNAEFPMISARPYRKALYFMEIYNALVDSGVEWEQVKNIGWTKLVACVRQITPENVDEWVSRATDMSKIQLIDYVAQISGKPPKAASEDGEESDLTSITFKVHADQKETIKEALEKARGEYQTEHDSVAVENICMSFLSGGGGKVKMPSLVEHMTQVGSLEKVLDAVGQVFPNAKIVVEP